MVNLNLFLLKLLFASKSLTVSVHFFLLFVWQTVNSVFRGITAQMHSFKSAANTVYGYEVGTDGFDNWHSLCSQFGLFSMSEFG